MTEWKPVWIARSDGEHEIKTKKNGRELNAPTTAQLDRNSGENDYYELLEINDPVAIEWKRILGGMLHREQKGPADQIWILVDFPENYRLYKRFKDKKESKSAKADGKDHHKSEDFYLYGYPLGHKKRFKSAVDFFPHLLWLAQGTSNQRTDCECKQCSPEWQRSGSQDSNKLSKAVPKIQPPASKASPLATKSPATAPAANVVPGPKMASVPSKATPQPANTSVARTPAPIVPTPLASAKSREQDQDAQYNKYIYRSGELTWFNRGAAWGLSIITKRDLFKDQRGQDRPRYLVQPLSHPFGHPSTKIISSEEDLRPWLAWSAPGPTHQSLATSNKEYKTIDWKMVLDGNYGVGDAEVDGSIYAAKMIDDSFTLIDPLSNNTITTGERSYNGIYFGGEKLWVGEPVRLRVGNGHDVMITHQIIEKLKPNSTNAASASVYIVGDIYRYTTIPYTVGQEPAENPSLPMRLRQDLKYRNRVSIASKRTISYWKLGSVATRLGITDIKGRWYESSILLPILHGTVNFQQDVQRGEVSDVGTWINGRGDANSAPGKAGTRYTNRVDAFDGAVPPGTKISKGLDGPAEENVFPVTAHP
ncbi:transcription-silencing protein Clr2-domain-containing protein, partial [Usnea florida]